MNQREIRDEQTPFFFQVSTAFWWFCDSCKTDIVLPKLHFSAFQCIKKNRKMKEYKKTTHASVDAILPENKKKMPTHACLVILFFVKKWFDISKPRYQMPFFKFIGSTKEVRQVMICRNLCCKDREHWPPIYWWADRISFQLQIEGD